MRLRTRVPPASPDKSAYSPSRGPCAVLEPVRGRLLLTQAEALTQRGLGQPRSRRHHRLRPAPMISPEGLRQMVLWRVVKESTADRCPVALARAERLGTVGSRSPASTSAATRDPTACSRAICLRAAATVAPAYPDRRRHSGTRGNARQRGMTSLGVHLGCRATPGAANGGFPWPPAPGSPAPF